MEEGKGTDRNRGWEESGSKWKGREKGLTVRVEGVDDDVNGKKEEKKGIKLMKIGMERKGRGEKVGK